MHAYNEYNNDRDKDNIKTVSGYALLNNSVFVPDPPYSHKTVLILIK